MSDAVSLTCTALTTVSLEALTLVVRVAVVAVPVAAGSGSSSRDTSGLESLTSVSSLVTSADVTPSAGNVGIEVELSFDSNGSLSFYKGTCDKVYHRKRENCI